MELREKVIKEFMKIVQIDSLSLKEEKMWEYLANRFQSLPVEADLQDYQLENLGIKASNFILKIPANNNSKKNLFFDAHVDTVEPGMGIKPLRKNGRVVSSGDTVLGSDDKAAAAAMIIAIEEIISGKMEHGDLYFIFTSAEEIGLVGVKHLDMSKMKVDFGFVLDSHGSVGGIILAAPYHHHYDIKIKGKASHAGIAPEKGINSIKIAAKIINQLPQGRINPQTVANVGMIEGGKATNIIPEECIVKGEFRSHSITTMHLIKQKIQQIVEKRQAQAVEIKLEFSEAYNGFRIPRTEPIIRLIEEAVQSIGIKPRFERTGGGSNTNVYNQKGLPCVTLATGMSDMHSVDESIAEDDLENLTRLVLKIVEFS